MLPEAGGAGWCAAAGREAVLPSAPTLLRSVWLYVVYMLRSTDEVEEEDVMPTTVEGQEIAVYRIEGDFFATADVCTHGYASLSEGVVVDDVIECPLHQGRFCIRTGKALSAPVSEAITTYETKLEDGRIFVRLTPAEGIS